MVALTSTARRPRIGRLALVVGCLAGGAALVDAMRTGATVPTVISRPYNVVRDVTADECTDGLGGRFVASADGATWCEIS